MTHRSKGIVNLSDRYTKGYLLNLYLFMIKINIIEKFMKKINIRKDKMSCVHKTCVPLGEDFLF